MPLSWPNTPDTLDPGMTVPQWLVRVFAVLVFFGLTTMTYRSSVRRVIE